MQPHVQRVRLVQIEMHPRPQRQLLRHWKLVQEVHDGTGTPGATGEAGGASGVCSVARKAVSAAEVVAGALGWGDGAV